MIHLFFIQASFESRACSSFSKPRSESCSSLAEYSTPPIRHAGLPARFSGKRLRSNTLGGLLVEADYVSSRIAEACGDLGRVRADGLHDLAPVGYDRINGSGYAVHHDVKEEAGLRGRRAPQHPGAAYFVDRIVKGSAAIASLSDVPAEYSFVEVGRTRNVVGGHLDVTDFSIRKCRRHQNSFPGLAILSSYQAEINSAPSAQYQFRFRWVRFTAGGKNDRRDLDYCQGGRARRLRRASAAHLPR